MWTPFALLVLECKRRNELRDYEQNIRGGMHCATTNEDVSEYAGGGPRSYDVSEPGFSGFQDFQDKRMVWQCSFAKGNLPSFEIVSIDTNS